MITETATKIYKNFDNYSPIRVINIYRIGCMMCVYIYIYSSYAWAARILWGREELGHLAIEKDIK